MYCNEQDHDQNLETPMIQGNTTPGEDDVQKQLEKARSNLRKVTDQLERSQTHIKETQRENIELYEKKKSGSIQESRGRRKET